MTDIPADVLEAAHKALMSELFFLCQPNRGDVFSWMDDHPEALKPAIARAILADRAAQAERNRELEDVRDFVARWAWRTDPPNASRKLSDSDRLSCIKHHPTIKRAAKPHIELAEAEAARAKEQETRG